MANYQSSLVEGARQVLLSLSLSPLVSDPAACNTLFASLKDIYPMYSTIAAARPDGQVYCSTLADATRPSLSDRDYFVQAVQTGEFSVGEVVTGRISHDTVIPMALPVLDDNQNPNLILLASIDMEKMLNYIDHLNLPKNSAMLVVDQNGKIVMRYPDSARWTGQALPDTPIIQKILKDPGEGSAEVLGVDSVQRLYAFTPLLTSKNNHVYIIVGIPSALAYASPNAMLRTNLIWIGLIALIALAVAWFGGDYFFLRVVSLTAERDEAESKLRDINAELEARVDQRTQELAHANLTLQNELVERKRVLAELRQQGAEMKVLVAALERSNRDLQDFAYIASHDLQEPLRKIQAFGERLSRKYDSILGEEGQDFLQRMNTSAYRMQVMINDLLAYSRVSTKGDVFSPVDLNKVAREVMLDLEIRLHETQGQILISTLPVIDADPSQMRQLLQNLITNALKFHCPGIPPVVRISIASQTPQSAADGTKMVNICVQDNGIGFEEKYTDRIFQPFQRLHSKNQYEGSGIGLAICRKIAERHGGYITAHSQPGQGSCFNVIIPLQQDQKELLDAKK